MPSSTASIERTIARASVATPLALLVFVAATLIGSLVAKPSLAEISRDYLTILTPNENLIGLYWLVLGLLLLGGSFRIVLARNVESKIMLANGVGLRLALAIGLMSVWTLSWALQLFLVGEIILLLNLLVAASIYGTLLVYRPSASASVLDYVFIQVPTRMLLCVLFSVDIWHQGLLALGWYRYLGTEPNHGPGKWEGDHAAHSWIAFGVIAGVAIINAGITFATTDVAWGLSCIYISIALAANGTGKPPQIYVTLILSAALVFVALASSIGMPVLARRYAVRWSGALIRSTAGWGLLKHDQEGLIRLAEEEEDERAREVETARAQAALLQQDPREEV